MFRLDSTLILLKVSLVLTFILIGGSVFAHATYCNLMCQLNIDQTDNHFTVQEFLDVLKERNIIQSNEEIEFSERYSYRRDRFSNVLETIVTINVDNLISPIYTSEIKLYIGYVGGSNPIYSSILSSEILNIQITTYIPISISWILY